MPAALDQPEWTSTLGVPLKLGTKATCWAHASKLCARDLSGSDARDLNLPGLRLLATNRTVLQRDQ